VIRATAISFAPMEGESASSLILRAASLLSPFPGLILKNFLGDAEAIASAVHRHDTIDVIAVVLGVEQTDLKRSMIHRAGHGLRVGPFIVRTQDIDQTHRRVCPAVLRADQESGVPPYQRLSWVIRVIRYDPVSSAPIIDRCACGCELLWSETFRIDECPSCGSRLLESMLGQAEPRDIEAVQFLGALFNESEPRRVEARCCLPTFIAHWTEGDLLEFFETLGLFSHLEVLTRLPREDTEVSVRAVGIRAALQGMDGIRKLIGRAFDDPPPGADRFWSTRRMAFANLAIRQCRSDPVRMFLEEVLRNFA
jgi:hypothetical protein